MLAGYMAIGGTQSGTMLKDIKPATKTKGESTMKPATLLIIVLLCFAPVAGLPQTSEYPATMHACVNRNGGDVRMILEHHSCRAYEIRTAWPGMGTGPVWMYEQGEPVGPITSMASSFTVFLPGLSRFAEISENGKWLTGTFNRYFYYTGYACTGDVFVEASTAEVTSPFVFTTGPGNLFFGIIKGDRQPITYLSERRPYLDNQCFNVAEQMRDAVPIELVTLPFTFPMTDMSFGME
jgi:hypothetical protein